MSMLPRNTHRRLEEPRYELSTDKALDEMLISSCLAPRALEESPWQALQRLIAWEVQMALDPQISSQAQALREQGWADAVECAKKAQKPRLTDNQATKLVNTIFFSDHPYADQYDLAVIRKVEDYYGIE